jgi:23S rRNA (uracil1939-C5)-methyltransferase
MEMDGAPVRAGERVEVEIHGIGHSGEGIGRCRNFTLFVPGAMPGDRVLVRVIEVKKNYARAALDTLLTPAPHRVAPPCPVVGECGGCQLQHIAYPEQLRLKRQQVADALVRLGGLEGVPVHPITGMNEPWGYRNKAQFPVGSRAGQVIAGFFAPGTHRIIEMDSCLIQHPLGNQVMSAVKRLAGKFRVPIYDEETHRGLLRHVLVRVARGSGEAMAVLVTNGPELPGARALAQELMAAVPGLVSVQQNINPQRTNVVLGDQTRLLAGSATLADRIGDLSFEISPRSFFQVNPQQTEVLYGKALEYAALTGSETVVDAYCGIGTISLFLARRARRLIGIEVVPEAVEDARRNAKRNGIENAEFLIGDAAVLMPRLFEDGLRPDVIVLDPPRKGCDRPVLEAAAAMSPERIVYVSCNPSTLARDLGLLAKMGYGTAEVQPVDMFPHTAHVECCALLKRVV